MGRYLPFRKFSIIFLLVVFLALSSLYIRPTLSLYYQITGGKLLYEVIKLSEHSNVTPFICGFNKIDPGEDSINHDIEVAINNLQKSIEYSPNLSHSYLLLGRAYCLSNLPEKAIEYYLVYTKNRPNNLLGKLELSFAREQANEPESTNYKESLSNWVKLDIGIDEFLRFARYAYRASDFSQAARWNSYAAMLAGDENFDHEVLNWNEDYLIIESFYNLENWSVCSWCLNAPGYFGVENGILEMAYLNNLEEREGFGFQYKPFIPIDKFSKIVIMLKGEPGTLFSFEVVIDGQRLRPIAYSPVPDEWSELEIAIGGKILEDMLISIGEPPSKPTTINQYRIFIDWIAVKK